MDCGATTPPAVMFLLDGAYDEGSNALSHGRHR